LLSGLELLVALVTVTVGATVMGTVSFGMALVIAPVLLLFMEPKAVVVIVNSLIAILLVFILFQTRRHLHWRLVWSMALGGVLAVPLGVLALDSANPRVLRITIVVVILCLAVLSLFNIQVPLTRRRFSGLTFGFLTSLSTAALSIGGPLAAIYVLAQGWPRQVIRASLAFYFLTANITAFAFYAWAGLVDWDTVANTGLLLPGLAVGMGLATLLLHRMNERAFRYVAIAVIITASLVTLGREVVRM
jgi:uncharacterized membrane protein YfcA